MSRGYKYCPMCRAELEEYDMREKWARIPSDLDLLVLTSDE